MKKLKVVTIVGTRPEIIRLSMLIPKLDKYTDHIFVHTGQNNDPKLNQIFFEDLELRQPDYYLNVDTSSMGAVMGDTLRKSEEVFLKEKPDAVMILGDTNSAIAAVVAERMHIPVYHMEAGNRSFDNNVPEELNRRLVDHVSSFNLPYNDYSMRNLLNEGIGPRYIAKTGSPMAEVIERYKSKFLNSSILNQLNLKEKSYFLASFHRQENVDQRDNLRNILEMLNDLSNTWNIPTVVTMHPRTKRRVEQFGLTSLLTDNLMVCEPFDFSSYMNLQMNSLCVLSDSGTISEESAILRFTAVTIRDSMERPEALEAGSITLAGLKSETVVPAVKFAIDRKHHEIPEGYDLDNEFSQKVINYLFSTAHLFKKWRNVSR